MKQILSLLIIILLHVDLSAQGPQKISYQSVIRNTNNMPVANTLVGIKISILQGSASGTVVYSETHSPSTNVNGLATIEIGGGTVVSGTFSSINWASGPYFVKTETDPLGGTAYTLSGTSQFLSVPYALYAETANVPGVPGPQGDPGPIGLTGATGPQGPVGATGPMGPTGLTGPAGPMGSMGPQGMMGLMGPMGPQGPVGPIGSQGLTGATGPMGPMGPMGPQGATGATGPAGPAGPAGATGATGPAGGGGVIYAERTVTETVNVSSPTYVNVVSVNLLANKIYDIKSLIYLVRNGASSTGITFRWVYSGNATTTIGMLYGGASHIPGTIFNSSGTFDTEAAGINTIAPTTLGTRSYEGIIQTSTAGTLTLQVARISTNTTLDFTLHPGSYIIARSLN